MATTMDEVQHYEAAPAEVFAMLSDPEFIERKCLASGSIEASAEATQEGGGVALVSRRVLPAKLPSFAKRFVGETVTLIETQCWSAPDGAGVRTATFKVDFGNNPISFDGAISLGPADPADPTGPSDDSRAPSADPRAESSGTRVEYTGAIKCTVPLVGRKIEGVALNWITRYVDKEQHVGTAWLAGDR